jgi:carbon storage regulator
VLVLRRRVGEAIAIGGDIEIEVIEISRTRVKLGVRAPQTVSVARREAVPIAAENRSASELLGNRELRDLEEILRQVRRISSGTGEKTEMGGRVGAGETVETTEKMGAAKTSGRAADMFSSGYSGYSE